MAGAVRGESIKQPTSKPKLNTPALTLSTAARKAEALKVERLTFGGECSHDPAAVAAVATVVSVMALAMAACLRLAASHLRCGDARWRYSSIIARKIITKKQRTTRVWAAVRVRCAYLYPKVLPALVRPAHKSQTSTFESLSIQKSKCTVCAAVAPLNFTAVRRAACP